MSKHEHVHAFLKEHPMGILSTVSADGTLWGAAIYYVADEDFNFYFVTRAETYKFHNMEEHPQVALTIADSDSQTTVQLSGTISTMPVQKYMDVFFDKFAKIKPAGDYDWAPPIDKIHKGNFMPLQLTPSKMQYANYGKLRVESHGDYSEQIIPAAK